MVRAEVNAARAYSVSIKKEKTNINNEQLDINKYVEIISVGLHRCTDPYLKEKSDVKIDERKNKQRNRKILINKKTDLCETCFLDFLKCSRTKILFLDFTGIQLKSKNIRWIRF